jgi:predicted dehydrogenase
MKFKVVGISFDHMHMGDLLRMVHTHPQAEIAGIYDPKPERMRDAMRNFNIPQQLAFKDLDACLEKAQPDIAIICSAPARHAKHVDRIAQRKVHMLVEKPFANSLVNADRMIASAKTNGVMLAINWPMRWQPVHCTAYRLLQAGKIGDLLEIHFYNGNRGPLFHGADKAEIKPSPAQKRTSWFYNRDEGGGSMQDYLGYGTTLGTWFLGGRKPFDVTSVVDRPRSLEVDEHSITVARYSFGLSKFETRWGTFTDPWKFQPQPKCGFVLKGSDGTISSYDYESSVRLQTRKNPAGEDIPMDVLKPPFENPVQYFIDCLKKERSPEGPLDPALSRIGQQIVDSAVLSAGLEKTIALMK